MWFAQSEVKSLGSSMSHKRPFLLCSFSVSSSWPRSLCNLFSILFLIFLPLSFFLFLLLMSCAGTVISLIRFLPRMLLLTCGSVCCRCLCLLPFLLPTVFLPEDTELVFSASLHFYIVFYWSCLSRLNCSTLLFSGMSRICCFSDTRHRSEHCKSFKFIYF